MLGRDAFCPHRSEEFVGFYIVFSGVDVPSLLRFNKVNRVYQKLRLFCPPLVAISLRCYVFQKPAKTSVSL